MEFKTEMSQPWPSGLLPYKVGVKIHILTFRSAGRIQPGNACDLLPVS